MRPLSMILASILAVAFMESIDARTIGNLEEMGSTPRPRIDWDFEGNPVPQDGTAPTGPVPIAKLRKQHL